MFLYIYTTGDFNFIYFGKKGGDPKSTPLVAVIHGGPHAVYSNEFNLPYSLFALLGNEKKKYIVTKIGIEIIFFLS